MARVAIGEMFKRGGHRVGLPIVNRAAMTYRYYEDNEAVLFDLTEDSIVSDAKTPEVSKIVGETMAETSRIVRGGNALLKITDDAPLDGFIQLR